MTQAVARVRRSRDLRASRRGVDVHARSAPRAGATRDGF